MLSIGSGTLAVCCLNISNAIFGLMKHVFSITSAHGVIHVNTHKLTIHTYGIRNDITEQNTTRSNSNKCNLHFNDSHSKFEKSPYKSACPNII